jgi:hypothetical protein
MDENEKLDADILKALFEQGVSVFALNNDHSDSL